jgi:hypothetical protein
MSSVPDVLILAYHFVICNSYLRIGIKRFRAIWAMERRLLLNGILRAHQSKLQVLLSFS